MIATARPRALGDIRAMRLIVGAGARPTADKLVARMNENGLNGPTVRYCRRCLFPETKPDRSIDAEGICDACRSAEVKLEIDWDQRAAELEEILERYRSKDGSNYDCVVPVSGGKDSTYQVMKILELGYRPL